MVVEVVVVVVVLVVVVVAVVVVVLVVEVVEVVDVDVVVVVAVVDVVDVVLVVVVVARSRGHDIFWSNSKSVSVPTPAPVDASWITTSSKLTPPGRYVNSYSTPSRSVVVPPPRVLRVMSNGIVSLYGR